MINFPPFIEGTIPAFTLEDGIKVSFVQNPAVNKNNVVGFRLLVKDMNSNIINSFDSFWNDKEKNEIVFSKLIEGQEKTNAAWNKEDHPVLVNGSHYYFLTNYICKNITNIKIQVDSATYVAVDYSPLCYINDYPNLTMKTYFYSNNTGTYIRIEDAGANNVTLQYSISNIYFFEKLDLKQSEYCKLQLAYLDSDQYNNYNSIAVYSTAAISKCIAKPEIIITDGSGDNELAASLGIANGSLFEYIGQYTIKDLSEPISSYSFTITNQLGDIYYESGEQFHNSETNEVNNSSLICKDSFEVYKDLESFKDYYIQYKIKTINGYEGASPKYLINYTPGLETSISININPILDYENGQIEVTLDIEKLEDQKITGSFFLLRSDNNSDFTEWEKLAIIPYGTNLNDFKWIDNTIASGVSYQYGLIQYNKYGTYTDRLESKVIKAYFEHMFLSDKDCQLKIKFNPEVSSFKNTILETKTDAIGGKYPFFFRNGIVKYKEFPISGLISYQMDDANTFIEKEEIGIVEPEKIITFNENINITTTNLVDYNYAAEKEFKLKVLDWLTNGRPKLFRSATEGNYIVRLINVSLSPENALGRMLHKFSTTAIESSDFTYSNLKEEGLIREEIDNVILPLQWKTINLNGNYYPIVTPDTPNEWNWVSITRQGEHIVWAHFSGLFPGDQIMYGDTKVTIGMTGEYKVNVPVDAIKVFNKNKRTGSVTYAYAEDLKSSKFESINSVVSQSILKSVSGSNIMSQLGIRSDDNNVEFYRLLFTLINPTYDNTNNRNRISLSGELEKDYIDLTYSEKLDINLSNFDANNTILKVLNRENEQLTKMIQPFTVIEGTTPTQNIVIGSNVQLDCYYRITKTTTASEVSN